MVNQATLSLHSQLAFELTEKLRFPPLPLESKLLEEELSDSEAATPLWEMVCVRVTVSRPSWIVKVILAMRALAEGLGRTE